MIFETQNKTGFYPYSHHEGIEIFKEGQNGFEYFYTVKQYAFNLPEGVYLVSDSFSDVMTGNPVYFEKIELPERNFINDPSKTQFFTGKNERKASIFLDDNYILFDKELYESLNELGRKYIIYHELGHLKYSSETDCDNYAKNMLIGEGFNPSQFLNFAASIFCNNIYRLDNLIKQSERWKS